MIEILARIALAATVGGAAAAAWMQHGKMPSRVPYNAFHSLPLIALEAGLIFLAGGWG